MEIFYLSIASGTQRKVAEILRYPYILINFMTKTNQPIKTAKTLFIDSGGFPSSFIYNGYNRSDLEYLLFVKKVKATYFALRDYPCEPQILQKHNTTVRQQILRTLEHHIKLLGLIDNYNISSIPVPVLQGWTVEDYLYCLDLFKEHGLLNFDYIAIGSLCRRHATKQIRKIILTVRKELRNSIKIHCFGTKVSALRDCAVWKAVHSVDSSAWDFNTRWKKYKSKYNISTVELSLKLAKEYLRKIERIKNKFEGQTEL